MNRTNIVHMDRRHLNSVELGFAAQVSEIKTQWVVPWKEASNVLNAENVAEEDPHSVWVVETDCQMDL
jgi:hypothetical protein